MPWSRSTRSTRSAPTASHSAASFISATPEVVQMKVGGSGARGPGADRCDDLASQAHRLPRRRLRVRGDHGDDCRELVTAQDDHRHALLDTVARPPRPVDIDRLVVAGEATRALRLEGVLEPAQALGGVGRVVLDRGLGRRGRAVRRDGDRDQAVEGADQGLRPVALAVPAPRQEQPVAPALVDVAGPLLRAIWQALAGLLRRRRGRRRGRAGRRARIGAAAGGERRLTCPSRGAGVSR